MNAFLLICGLTTVLALAALRWAGHSAYERHMLPWTAGVLLGISIFWVLPEMAADGGWITALARVSAVLLLLGLIDRYVYPLCPFCASGMHANGEARTAASCGHTVTLGWPLLVFACAHTFFDGWTIALSQSAARSNAVDALSWAVVIHKLPESVAIGVLTARLASSRKMAIAAVLLIQTVMMIGGFVSILANNLDTHLAQLSAIPACAFLMLFGLLTLNQEWRVNGWLSAIRAAAPGLLVSGLAALVTTKLAQ